MKPSYLNLNSKQLKNRIKKARKLLPRCKVCPRKCGTNRLKDEKDGFCRLGRKAVVASSHPHFGEEKVLVGTQGSGTIFFAHCNLACQYCQNYNISQLNRGKEVTKQELSDMMINLQNQGCHNINLVTPTPNVPQILEALPQAIYQGLSIPLVYNSSGYDRVKTLRLLSGIIDIYMPDIKYASQNKAQKYSQACRYPEIAKKAVTEMHRQVGDLKINPKGIAQKGLLIRHLVLPENIAGSKEILRFIADVSPNSYVNVMDQYRPCFKASQFPELSRPITKGEYQQVTEYAKKLGLRLPPRTQPLNNFTPLI